MQISSLDLHVHTAARLSQRRSRCWLLCSRRWQIYVHDSCPLCLALQICTWFTSRKRCLGCHTLSLLTELEPKPYTSLQRCPTGPQSYCDCWAYLSRPALCSLDMGVAALPERTSSERSASQTRVNPKKGQSVLSPVYRRSITGSAPSTPSAAMQTEGFKRITKPTTDDEQGNLLLVKAALACRTSKWLYRNP